MSSFREKIRTSLPFTVDIYEFAVSKKAMLPSKKKFELLTKQGAPIYLDLGGADSGKDEWISVDMTLQCDIYWDLRLPIPLPDNSVSKIYSSHLFEHLTYSEGQKLLKESFRLLKPGGTFSICVPNARIYVDHYLGVKEVPQDYFGWKPAFNNTTAIDAINYVAYMDGEHKYMFDQQNLLHILTAAGFANVTQRDFDPNTDKAERDYESLYAIGTKL
jgi:predicted SAM-dependent methyltransferase